MPPTNKQLPKKTLVIGGIALAGIGYYIYKKKKENTESQKATEANPYLAQSFIPVTAENVAGVGALSGVNNTESNTALFEAQKENEKTILEFLEGKEARKIVKEENAQRLVEGEKERQSDFQKLLTEMTLNQTGGGAPVGQTNTGTVTASPSPGQPTSPPSNTGKTSAGGCPADFPLWNPAPGKGCYRISRTTTGGGCQCHGYKNGKLECQQGSIKNGSCHW